VIDLERVATFIAVVKCGGFREAAKQTGLSQPTVTQHIKRLEQSLQARLIDRATMPQSLTLEGKIFSPMRNNCSVLAIRLRQPSTIKAWSLVQAPISAFIFYNPISRRSKIN